VVASNGDASTVGALLVRLYLAYNTGEANFLSPGWGNIIKLDETVGISTFHLLFLDAFGVSAYPLT
jgi:hypothetical protein